jgi:hypothetical protein
VIEKATQRLTFKTKTQLDRFTLRKYPNEPEVHVHESVDSIHELKDHATVKEKEKDLVKRGDAAFVAAASLPA